MDGAERIRRIREGRTDAPQQFDPTDHSDQIGAAETAIRRLHGGDGLVEIRAIDVPVDRGRPIIVSGYFTDPHAAAVAAIEVDGRGGPGVYCTIQHLHPACLARSPHRLTDRPTHTTTDADVVRRRWVFIDLDTNLPAGTSASGGEVAITRDAAMSVVAWLGDDGWGMPIVGSSGNGSCLLYPIDLPNDADTTDLLKRFYGGLAANRNGMVGCHVDQSVFNAARLVRVPGTTNRKGASLPDRPHRICKWEYPPE